MFLVSFASSSLSQELYYRAGSDNQLGPTCPLCSFLFASSGSVNANLPQSHLLCQMFTMSVKGQRQSLSFLMQMFLLFSCSSFRNKQNQVLTEMFNNLALCKLSCYSIINDQSEIRSVYKRGSRNNQFYSYSDRYTELFLQNIVSSQDIR